jgi:transcriptional regulator with XRE-family HTH domain
MVTPGFGTRIKNLRERQSLSRKELGDMLKITAHAIGYFEDEKRRPKWEVLARMAQALGTTEYYKTHALAQDAAVR